MAVSLHHLQLPYPAGEEEPLRRFYNGLLGMAEVADPGGRTLRFFTEAERLDFVPTGNWAVAPGFYFALEVPGYTALLARLHEARCTVYGRPPVHGRRRAWVTDPNGYTLEIIDAEHTPEFAV